MRLTPSSLTPAARADRTTLSPSGVSPAGSTGSVYQTSRSGRTCWRIAIASLRRAIEAGSATAAPSMSKSSRLSEYQSTTEA